MGIESAQDRHRPGALKQQNKTHKHGRHRSKGAIDDAMKGTGMLGYLSCLICACFVKQCASALSATFRLSVVWCQLWVFLKKNVI
jgi:hypothetical protein